MSTGIQASANPTEPKTGFRQMLQWLLALRGSNEAIALGVAIGVFVAFTPTLGFQVMIAVGLATAFNANRPAAAIMVGLTNPLTIPVAYTITYWVGSWFWSGPPVREVYGALGRLVQELARLDILAIREPFEALLSMGWDVFVAFWIGGVVVGGVLAVASYAITLRTVAALRRHRARPPAPAAQPESEPARSAESAGD